MAGGGGEDDEDDEKEELRRRVAALDAELGRTRALVETIFARIPAVFYVKDLDSRYQYGSPWGFRTFGIDPAQAIGRTDAELFPPALAERFAASDRRVLEGREMASVSYALPAQSGVLHFAGVRFPIPGPDGEPVGICGFAVDVTERIELANELERLATTDALTGLANRRRFDERFSAEIARAARSGEPLTLVLCDVDQFKRYNDRYGHPRGDACLVEVARALDGIVRRPADLAARYGGEEFALVFPDTAEEGATKLVERLRASVRALGLEHEGNDGHGVVTLSAGVATVVGAWTVEEVIDLADRALYAAKEAGRDRHVAVSEAKPPASSSRVR
ncbi:MAG: GGDEF domain-containing protein [Labilithrix sp.]|nr:GGDEF domain-containing protein [Labilithrix sp.]MBX3212026.1 GGDEF domain-containing protein [Labilithrix sp.]